MITDWLFVIGMVLIGILCYCIGLRRGIKEMADEYDTGYNDALAYCEQNYQMEEINAVTDGLCQEYLRDKDRKARELISQLGELFEYEDDDIIDGGYY